MAPEDGLDTARADEPLEPALLDLRARLVADFAATMETVAGLDQVQADWRPAPGRWSIGEILHHLVLANGLFVTVVRRLVERGRREGLTASQGNRRSWHRLRSIADVSVSGPVTNPPPATPTHGLPLAGLRRDLEATHEAMTGLVSALTGLDVGVLRLRHPLGLELNLYQWVDSAGAHERRHVAQINAVAADPGFPGR
jgi:hypothetical protein